MALSIAPELQQRIEALARQQACSVDDLLERALDSLINTPPKPLLAQRLLDLSPDLIFLGKAEGVFTYANPAAIETLGHPAEALLTQPFVNFIHPDDRAAAMVAHETVTGGQVISQMENRYRCADGTYKWLSWTASIDESGTIYAIARDVTEQKETQARLADSEARLKGVVESQIDLVSRYLPDTTLLYVNEAYSRYFNVPREQLIGQSYLPLTGGMHNDEIMARLEEVTRNPAPDVRILSSRGPDGQVRWIQWVDYGIVDKAGKVVEIQAVGRDITELKLAEQSLQAQNEVLQTIFDHIPVMIAFFDVQGRFEMVNRYWVEMLGWTLEEMLAHPDIMVAFYPDPDYRAQALQYMLEARDGWRDFETVAKDGTVVHTTWANVRLSDGRSIGIGQDLRDRKKLEEQRLYAHQLEIEMAAEREMIALREQLISMLSHDLRTPLAAIFTTADFLNHYLDRLSPLVVRERLDIIAQQTQHMVSMLEDVLTLNKANAGMLRPVFESVDVGGLCRRLLDTARLLDEGAHQFVLRLDSGPGTIQGDSRMLEHLFANLLTNAIKYSPPGTPITLGVALRGMWWVFSVVDEGIGIPPEAMDTLFEPYQRAYNARHKPGTGLGLTIVKRYVDIHQGEIDISSVIGEGTRITVRLPA